jgi:uncharacterized protein (DUF2336 family)
MSRAAIAPAMGSALIETLSRDEAARVRAALARAIARRDDVPVAVVRRLAGDGFDIVCAPVLRDSPLLAAADLRGLALAPRSPGARAAIAGRAQLDPDTAAAIAASDDAVAIAVLLENPGARLTAPVLDALVARAPRHPAWHAALVDRPDMPRGLLRRIAGFVGAALRQRLVARPDFTDVAREDPEDAAVASRAAIAPAAAAEGGQDAAEATELVDHRLRRLQRAGQLDAAAIDAALDRGDHLFARGALALRAGVETDLVDRVLRGRSAKGLVALAWRAGLDPRLAYRLQLRLAGLPPRLALAPRAGDWPLDPAEMAWRLDFFGAQGPT